MKLLLTSILLVMAALTTAQDSSLQPRPGSVSPEIAAEAQKHVERANALYRDHKFEEALKEAREAKRLDPNNSGAIGLVTLLSMSRSHVSNLTSDEKTTPPAHHDPNDILLRADHPILLRLSQTVKSNSSDTGSLRVEVAHDVRVNGAVLIEKHAPVKYSIERQAAGDKFEPGVVSVVFESIHTLAGEEISLAGSQSNSGVAANLDLGDCGEACGVYVFFLPFLYLWDRTAKGAEGVLHSGLLTAVYPRRDSFFRLPNTPEAPTVIQISNDEAANRRTRLHFYFNDNSPEKTEYGNGFLPYRGLPVRLDNASIGALPSWHYACTTVNPGAHVVKVGRHSFRLFVQSGQEYFVKAETHKTGMTVDLTDDYEIGTQPLLPSALKKQYAMECWD